MIKVHLVAFITCYLSKKQRVIVLHALSALEIKPLSRKGICKSERSSTFHCQKCLDMIESLVVISSLSEGLVIRSPMSAS